MNSIHQQKFLILGEYNQLHPLTRKVQFLIHINNEKNTFGHFEHGFISM